MAAATDAEILTLYREGRVEAAFRLMVAAHGEKVYNIALFTLNDENLAADASQEVFIKVYRNLGRFKGDAILSTWLYRIAKNVCYDLLKKRRPERLEEDQERLLASPTPGPEAETIRDWEHRRLRAAVSALPEGQRMAVNLYYFQQYSYEEIAEVMNQPLGTIKSYLYRAKSALAAALPDREK